jgi:hypothetical protein
MTRIGWLPPRLRSRATRWRMAEGWVVAYSHSSFRILSTGTSVIAAPSPSGSSV